MVKRARGILSRECRRTGKEPGQARSRFLDAISCRGVLCNFETAEGLCRRLYELCDNWGLAHPLLSCLAAGARAAGYDVILCPDPMDPERLRHVLIPALSLGFVSSTSALPCPGKRPYRRLRFSRKMSAALVDEAVEAMAQAKAMHDALEALYNPHVDFDRVHAQADAIAAELLARA